MFEAVGVVLNGDRHDLDAADAVGYSQSISAVRESSDRQSVGPFGGFIATEPTIRGTRFRRRPAYRWGKRRVRDPI